MKTLYLDIFSGISGDMFIGALLDLGVKAQDLERELEKLQLDGYRLHVARGQKAGIEGVKFDVHLTEHSHGSTAAHHTPPAKRHAPDHGHAAHGTHGGPLAKTSRGQIEP